MRSTTQLVATINQHGIRVESPPPAVRRLLQFDGRKTLTPRDGRGTVISLQPNRQYMPIDGNAILLPTGAWRLLQFATSSLGHALSVRVASDVRLPWEQADADANSDDVVEYVASRSFSVLCYPTDSGCAEIAARIVNGLPAENIGLVTASIAQANRLRCELRKRGIEASDAGRGDKRGILVGVDGSFREPSWLGLVIVVNAGRQLGDRENRVYRHGWRAKRLALVDDRLRLTYTERARILMRYGFEWRQGLRDGSLARPIEVAVINANRRQQDTERLSGTELERRLIWLNSSRNRRIASWSQENLQLRPIVVVGSIEHAAELAALLPAWQILAGRELSWIGLSARHGTTIGNRASTVQTRPAIVTPAGLSHVAWQDVDVVVRADAATGLPNLPEAAFVATQRRLPLTIVDIDDSQMHPTLAKRVRDRRRAYQQAEWYPRGIDPVEARMAAYLRERMQ